MDSAQSAMEEGSNVKAPVSIQAPRGRPPKNASERLKSWYEQGPNCAKKRKYLCSLCGLDTHTAKTCELRETDPFEADGK